MDQLEGVIKATEPFCRSGISISQSECQGYFEVLSRELEAHDVKLHEDNVRNKHIYELEGTIIFSQDVHEGAARITIERVIPRKEILLIAMTKFDSSSEVYIPQQLTVLRPRGGVVLHEYFWY